MTWKRKGKFKTGHKKSEEKGENLMSECLCFKGDTPIMVGPSCESNIEMNLHERGK